MGQFAELADGDLLPADFDVGEGGARYAGLFGQLCLVEVLAFSFLAEEIAEGVIEGVAFLWEARFGLDS